MDAIYLDHNASTPVHPWVLDAMLPWLRGGFGNPSSSHAWGRAARAAIDRARAQVATLIGAAPEEIIFTSGGTEASNLAIRGTAAVSSRKALVTSTIEHPATAAPCALLAAQGWLVHSVAVDALGVLDLGAAISWLGPDTALVTVMLANNETGALQPLAALATQAQAVGAVVHTDAAQAVGKVPVDVEELGVDLLTIAGHKLYAPMGVGALYRRSGTPLAPVLLGAGHEGGLRPGTENVAGIVGLGQACALAGRDLDAEAERESELCELLWGLLSAGIPGLQRNGPVGAEVLPNTLNISVPGMRGADLLAAVPEVAASTGSACHEGADRPSTVLRAMGLSHVRAMGSLRLSVGRGSDDDQIRRAADYLVAGWCRT